LCSSRTPTPELATLSLHDALPISRTVLDDVAVPMEVVHVGKRVVFEPDARAFDVAAETPQDEYRRKLRTLVGNFQLVALHPWLLDRKSTRLNSSHLGISYAVFCWK